MNNEDESTLPQQGGNMTRDEKRSNDIPESAVKTCNFDLIVAGCNTRCRHCYVNGGPGGMMPLADILDALEKLDALAELLPYEAEFTLDNEPMNHPDIGVIIRAAAAAEHIRYFHHGMTAGIALMARKDREKVMRAYLDRGFRDFGITVHGNVAHHDMIVRREGARRTASEAAEYMRACGAEIGVSLMFNRFFREDADEIDALLERLRPDWIYIAVPNFTPHKNMMDFEPFRGTLEALHGLRTHFALRGQRNEKPPEGVFTPGMLIKRLEGGPDIAELFLQPQDEMYLTVHPDGNLFYGNTGAETECLGNMRTLDIPAAARRIRELPGNRDWGAFYDAGLLPGREEMIRALKRVPGDLAYSDMASVVYRALAETGIPTKIK